MPPPAKQTLGTHPELSLEIARVLVESDQWIPATSLLHEAMSDDKTRTTACLLLAQMEMSSGHWVGARNHLERAREAAPSWVQVLEALAFVQERLDNAEQAQTA